MKPVLCWCRSSSSSRVALRRRRRRRRRFATAADGKRSDGNERTRDSCTSYDLDELRRKRRRRWKRNPFDCC